MTTLFVSDLHLSQNRPEKLSLFKTLMAKPASNADALYILGDLFDDFWIGCNDQDAPNPEIISTLKTFTSEYKTPVYLMRGNRDFHLDVNFSKATGCTLINDPYVTTLNNKKILLMHGDTLCTDDIKYQQWRKFITHPFIKWLYFVLPLFIRKRIARGVRGYTVNAVKKKPPEIIDVSQETVENTFNQFSVDMLIHGHTHRQAIHEIELNGKQLKRIVLGDWYEQDCILIYDQTGFRFERVKDYIDNFKT